MARPRRIEFPDAIYHAMSRGNGRRKIFRDERDDGRFLEGLETTVDKFGFEIFSFVCMPNPIHIFLRTPEPNLSMKSPTYGVRFSMGARVRTRRNVKNTKNGSDPAYPHVKNTKNGSDPAYPAYPAYMILAVHNRIAYKAVSLPVVALTNQQNSRPPSVSVERTTPSPIASHPSSPCS